MVLSVNFANILFDCFQTVDGGDAVTGNIVRTYILTGGSCCLLAFFLMYMCARVFLLQLTPALVFSGKSVTVFTELVLRAMHCEM